MQSNVKWSWWDSICFWFGIISYDRACRKILLNQSAPKQITSKLVQSFDNKELLVKIIQEQIIKISKQNLPRKKIGYLFLRGTFWENFNEINNRFEPKLFIETLKEMGHGASFSDTNLYLIPNEPHLLDSLLISDYFLVRLYLYS